MEPHTTPKTVRLIGPGLPRLLAVSVGLPVVIIQMDRLAIEAGKSAPSFHIFLPVLFVAQVGLLAVCAGRFVDNVFLKCVVFAWSIALVDALAMSTLFFGHGSNSQCMTFALLSGQIGLLTIWGMMNRLSWPVRIPILLASLLVFVMIMMGNSGSAPWRNESQVWAVILAIQSALLVVICSVMRYRGYRLAPVVIATRDTANANGEQLQFSIKHIIFWTTTVASILVVAKSIDWLLMEAQEFYWSIVLALGMGLVTLVSMFVTLGSRQPVLRILTLLVGPPLIGMLLKWATSHWTMTWGTTRSAWIFYELKEFGYGWVVWSVLAAWFLTALLLVFRASGYQLVRTRPAASGVASSS